MSVTVRTSNNSTVVSASGESAVISVSGGIGPKGEDGAGGVASLNGATGILTLAAVGASWAVAGTTITLTVAPGVSSWNDLTDKPATFPPSTHTHTASQITDFSAAVVAAAPPTTNASLLTSGTLADARLSANVVFTADARLTDSREWSASTVTQAAAEAGTDTTRVAWTVQRVWQAIAAWWAASPAKTKLDGIAVGATANSSDATLLARANHTGTQDVGTITGLGTLATQSGTFSGTSSGVNTGDQTITLSGDVTGSGTGSFAATLSASGVSAGTYTSVTVDTKGRVTAGSSPTTLSGYGITDGVTTSDSRLTDARTPTGAAGGDLTGTFPNPTIAAGAVTLAKSTGLQKSITVSSAAPTGGSSGDLYVQTSAAGQVTPATLTADANDYAPGVGDIYRLSANAARNITGWTAWTDGTVKLLVNVGANAITLKHQSTSSSASNRFITSTAGDYIVPPGGSAIIYWDATDSRVRAL